MAARGKAKLIDIFVWDTTTCETIQKLSGFHRRAVRLLEFSPRGDKLLSTGEDDYHSVAVYEWKSGRLIASSKVDGERVFSARFKNETEFVTVGAKHVKIWKLNGANLEAQKGLFGKLGPTAIISCTWAFRGKLFTGTPKG